jgi:hypothetical protein
MHHEPGRETSTPLFLPLYTFILRLSSHCHLVIGRTLFQSGTQLCKSFLYEMMMKVREKGNGKGNPKRKEYEPFTLTNIFQNNSRALSSLGLALREAGRDVEVRREKCQLTFAVSLTPTLPQSIEVLIRSVEVLPSQVFERE